MALRKEGRIVIAEPDLALSVLPYECLEWKIDTDGLSTFHKRGAALGISEDEHLGRPQRLADSCGTGGVVNAREDIEPRSKTQAASRTGRVTSDSCLTPWTNQKRVVSSVSHGGETSTK